MQDFSLDDMVDWLRDDKVEDFSRIIEESKTYKVMRASLTENP